ncbi:hypothetical protein DFJ58DRAFT_840138 [Suillus subalutaceus]|uniref:uncharacterized protein n=1 Tax=Suillus subalutaceus TaxID=48586 RepID=UPI001B87F549|nr:uncharacterized protein DFJ58DRAFT_840138 [Suillus subalutaceus]KAG1859561.1 hypothetical protein DFJ58DRAFT_840138 [Suillus subalutaceus]
MDASRVPDHVRVAGVNSAAATSALSSGHYNFREKDLTLRCLPTNGLRIVKMQGLSGLSHRNIEQHVTHATVDDILRKEIAVPDETQRYSIDATLVVWGNKAWVSNAGLRIPEQMNILLAVLQALGILDIQLPVQMQTMVTQWNVPKQDAQDDRQVMATIQRAIGEILDSNITPQTVKIRPRPLPNLVPGPDFNASAPPAFHESDVAYLYWTISVVVWAYLRSSFVMSHFPSSVISLAHNYVAQLSAGPLLTLCLTDRGGNCTTKDVNASKAEDITIFIQVVAHFTLAPDDELGDDQFFPTFSRSFEMTFPTIILLAKPAILSAGQYPQHVVVKDSWPTPAETHEAYLIRHIPRMLDFPDILHKYFCQSVNPNNGELVHEATNVRQSCAVIDPNDGDVMMLQEMFERRLRYRLVFKDVVVDSTWFSSRREYLTCIMHNLEAHLIRWRELPRFSTRTLRLQTSGLSSTTASAEAAVPGWVGDDPPLPRQAQLGDFGLGFKPSDKTGDGGGTGGLMRAGNATIKKEHAAKLKDKPSQAMDRSGSPLYMSNETLTDPFGQFIVHTSKHNLEGFWWSMLWVTINCEGPYDILTDRLASLGNWRFYRCLIHPFWRDPAILRGLEEMFRIFMPANLIRESDETLDTERDFVPYVPLDDSAVGATHEMMIDIIKRMLKDMKDEAPPSPKVIEDAQEICTRQECSASHESRQSQNNRHPGLMIPPGIPGHWKRPYLGTYTPKPGRSSAVSAPSPAVDSVDRARLRTDTTMSLPSSSTSTSTSSRVPTQPSDTQRLQYPISQTILGPDFFHGLPSFNLHGSASTGLVHTTLPAIHEDEDGDENNRSRKKPRWQGL